VRCTHVYLRQNKRESVTRLLLADVLAVPPQVMDAVLNFDVRALPHKEIWYGIGLRWLT